jgi:DNA invertase Pin-like site-specific DNA recombinase
MANSLVIRKGTSVAKRNRALRAVQYVRMSTDHQRYSIQNQAAAIATFAQQNNLTIVGTYRDDGRSGLRINGRRGLTELINDVQSGHADFDHILVYDVSRWGRFQDIDESAYYEYICKQNGVEVAYCAEQFDNDGSLLASIVKNIKRVMAAEYSRELSVKVHAGQSRIASLGYRVGGPLTFGLRRELIDESKRSKGWLARGERKSLQTDRVLLRVGSEEETAIVRWIFNKFVVERSYSDEIARQLNKAKIANHNGSRWTGNMIHNVLRNENYIGNIVYNRTSRRLGQALVRNPRHLWVRCESVVEPVVDKDLFARAQKIMAERYISIPEDQMLKRLRVLLHRKGRLTSRIIESAAGVPSVSSYTKHFGSLRKAFARIGYHSPRDCDWLDSRGHWSEVVAELSAKIAEPDVTVMVARHLVRPKPSFAPQWRAYRRSVPARLVVIVRLNEANNAIHDYVLLPRTHWPDRYLRLSKPALGRMRAVKFKTADELIEAIKARRK